MLCLGRSVKYAHPFRSANQALISPIILNRNVNKLLIQSQGKQQFSTSHFDMMASLTSGSSGLERSVPEKNRFPMIKTKSGKHIQYVDQCIVRVKGGRGGNGLACFLREKYKPIGKASGGDGGSGGNVFIKAVDSRRSLCDIDFMQKAQDGDNGQKRNKNGRKGDSVTIYVPLGTQIFDADTGDLFADLSRDGDEVLVAKGGKGGLGNQHFSTSTNRSPQYSQDGQPGEGRVLKLKLKTIADVGLLGYPNAGKSTLLGSISNAKPKVAAYSFTTLHPTVGEVFHAETGHSFSCADIPGLIEGMNSKIRTKGLGHDFLQHIERTKLLLYVVDVSGLEGLGIQYNEETGEVKYEFITETTPFDYDQNTEPATMLKRHADKRTSISKKNSQMSDEDSYRLKETALTDYFGEEEGDLVISDLDNEEDDEQQQRMTKRQLAQERFRKRTPLLRTISPEESTQIQTRDETTKYTILNEDEGETVVYHHEKEDIHEEDESDPNYDPYANTVLDTLPEFKRKQRLYQPWDILRLLKKEVELYMPGLSDRALCIVANKMDVPGAEKNFEILKEFVKNEFGNLPIVPVSAKDMVNVENVKLFCIEYLEKHKKAEEKQQ